MNLRLKVSEMQQVQKDLVEDGYTAQEAIQLIQAAAMCELAQCVTIGYDCKSHFSIQGAVATYEQ